MTLGRLTPRPAVAVQPRQSWLVAACLVAVTSTVTVIAGAASCLQQLPVPDVSSLLKTLR